MNRHLDWPRYSRWTWILASLAALLLIVLWLMGRGPSAACCAAPAIAVGAAPVLVAAAPAVTPPAATPALAAVSAPAAAAPDAGPQCKDTMSLAATFATGSAQLTRESKTLLHGSIKCMASGTFEVSGHTDNVGQAARNLDLSQRRAQAVVTYLGSKGVEPQRLLAKGYGDTTPVADNSTKQGQAQNRRIEFKKQ